MSRRWSVTLITENVLSGIELEPPRCPGRPAPCSGTSWLQMCFYFSLLFPPCWTAVLGVVLHTELDRMDVLRRYIYVTVLCGAMLMELVHLHVGYVGSLREEVLELAGSIMSLLLACCCTTAAPSGWPPSWPCSGRRRRCCWRSWRSAIWPSDSWPATFFIIHVSVIKINFVSSPTFFDVSYFRLCVYGVIKISLTPSPPRLHLVESTQSSTCERHHHSHRQSPTSPCSSLSLVGTEADSKWHGSPTRRPKPPRRVAKLTSVTL